MQLFESPRETSTECSRVTFTGAIFGCYPIAAGGNASSPVCRNFLGYRHRALPDGRQISSEESFYSSRVRLFAYSKNETRLDALPECVAKRR